MESKLVIKTDQKWFDQISVPTATVRVPRDQELELKREAEALLVEENEKYKRLEKKSKKSDIGWIRSVLTKGALSDKVAAHVLLLQNSAPHNLASLTALVQMSLSKGKREYILAMDRLKDLFLAELLPQRKLKPFNELVSNLSDEGRARSLHLMLAYFEDQLRFQYHQFVEGVERVTHDPVPATKSKSINVLYELLSSNPEHEQYILEKLVNKLGDPSSKVASHVSFLLQKLITENHPVMKDVVVTEVHRVLFRPNISEKAQYYCLCFLQGIVFTDFDQLIANKMIEIYFTFFKKITSSGDVNNKIMSALLSGMSRALPYSTMGAAAFEQHLETFYKLIHFVNMNIAIQGLSLIFSVVSNHKSAALGDRYYCALWRFLQEHDLEKSKKLTMLLNLLFKSMKHDKKPSRVYAFIKKLTSIALNSNPPFLASVVFLVSQILNVNGKVSKIFYLSEHERNETKNQNSKSREQGDMKKENQSEWDMNVRNPLCLESGHVSPWEFSLLTNHYHPSVSLFSEGITKRETVTYDGDPIEDFSLRHFLDRFVYRNPKEVDTKDSLVSRQKSLFGRQIRTRKDEARNVDTKEYLDLPESRIPLEERFIYKYLKDRGPKVKKERDEDIESVGSDEFERLLDRFESDFKDDDFANELKQTRNKKRNHDDNEDSDDEQDDEMNFDEDDEYEATFGSVKDDLEEAFQDDDDDSEIPARCIKKFKGEKSSRLFESAEKFAHLLNDGDSDKESDDERPPRAEKRDRKKDVRSKGNNFKKRFKKGFQSKATKKMK